MDVEEIKKLIDALPLDDQSRLAIDVRSKVDRAFEAKEEAERPQAVTNLLKKMKDDAAKYIALNDAFDGTKLSSSIQLTLEIKVKKLPNKIIRETLNCQNLLHDEVNLSESYLPQPEVKLTFQSKVPKSIRKYLQDEAENIIADACDEILLLIPEGKKYAKFVENLSDETEKNNSLMAQQHIYSYEQLQEFIQEHKNDSASK